MRRKITLTLIFVLSFLNLSADAFHIQYHTIGWPYSGRIEMEGVYNCLITTGGTVQMTLHGIYAQTRQGNNQTHFNHRSLNVVQTYPNYNTADINFTYSAHITAYLPYTTSPINFAPEYHMDVSNSGNRSANLNCQLETF